jgi:hypothetical protein
MDDHTFTAQLDSWMSTGAFQLIHVLPSSSGMCRLIDLYESEYKTGFTSFGEGSFKPSGIGSNWYGTDFLTAFAENKPTGSPIYEVTRFLQDVPVLNMYNLPVELRAAIHEDRDLISGRFSKSHIVMEVAAKYLPPPSFSGVFWPSRRGPGGVILYDPSMLPVEFYYTGTRLPSGF